MSTRSSGPKRQHGRNNGDFGIAEDTVFRRVRGILNKLTVEKFDSLVDQLVNVGIVSEGILRGIIFLLFEKALDEPTFSSLYAQVCLTLSQEAPNFEAPEPGHDKRRRVTTFTRLLLRKCQDEFENRSKACELANERTPPAPGVDPRSDEYRRIMLAEEAEILLARRKMLGNIKFIGELGKLGLLSEKIMHDCIKQLLHKVRDAEPQDVECLCRLLRTIGKQLDHDRARAHIDKYFQRMRQLLEQSPKLESRVRFMVEDVLALREHNWIPREQQQETGPKTINEIRLDALQEQVAKSSGKNRRAAIRGLEMQQRALMQQYSAENNGYLGPSVTRDRGVPSLPGDFQGMTRQDPMALHGLLPDEAEVASSPPRGSPKNSHRSPRNSPRGLRQVSADQISLRPGSILSPASHGKPRNSPQKNRNEPIDMVRPAGPVAPTKPAGGRQQKKPKPTKEELDKMSTALLEEYLSVLDMGEATKCVKELRVRNFFPTLVKKAIVCSLERKTQDQEAISKLLCVLVNDERMLTPSDIEQGLEAVLADADDLRIDIPLIDSILAGFVGRFLVDNVLKLKSLMSCFVSGAFPKIFLGGLKQLAATAGDEKLVKLYNSEKVDLTRVLPSADQSFTKLMDFVREYNLGCLFPLLAVEDKISAKLNELVGSTDTAVLENAELVPSLQSFFKSSFDAELVGSPDFLSVLAKCVFKRVHELVRQEDGTVSKEDKPIEKKLFIALVPVIQEFSGEDTPLQKVVIYSLQQYCFEASFPKGYMLRMSVLLYDEDIVEEEAFMAWREELLEEVPGKTRDSISWQGEALIAVNEYLNWMKTAVEEEESDEEDD